MIVHKEQHHIFQILEENGYKGIYYRSKVIYLNDGTNNTKLDNIKATILSLCGYCGDFD